LPYTSTITLDQWITEIASRLYDPNNRFWSRDEIALHLQDAIRFWNILTGDNRVTFALNLDPTKVWYDFLSTTGTYAVPSSPRAAIFTDDDVYIRVQLLLMEGSTPLIPLTSQFMPVDFSDSLQQKRDEFLLRSGCTRSIHQLTIMPNIATVTIPESVIISHRGTWLPANPAFGTPYTLYKIDAFTDTAYQPFATISPADPQTFSAGMESPLTLTLTPPPANPGQIELTTVDSQPVLTTDPLAPPVTLLIPSDFMPGLMWATLSNCLTNSLEASDQFRADYADKRFGHYIELLNRYGFVLTAKVNGLLVYADAVETLDQYSPNWRTTQAIPSIIAMSGQNLLAIPCSTAQTITLQMVANANVPVNLTDNVQFGQEILDALSDYAQHTLSFKMGGARFSATFPLMQTIATVAAARNANIRSTSFYMDAMNTTSQREKQIETVNAGDN